MNTMRSTARLFLAIGLVALFVQSALAHTYLSAVVLGGTKLAEGDCVRAHPAIEFDSPISSITSADMTCGFRPEAARAANRKCPIAAGSTIGFQWHHNHNGPSDDILDPTHQGPVLFYLSKTNDGSGNSWFKIYEDGYNPSTKKWATDKLIANRGIVTITIPSDIEAGNYLIRGEILALHNAYFTGGVQPYVGCVELTISGGGNKNPSANGVAFPGAYKSSDEGLNLNVYQYYSSYKIPGPAVYVAGSSSSGSSTATPTVKPPTTPTNTPTSAPTNAPTSTPTSAPSGGSIKLQMSGGSSAWWLGVVVTGGSQTIVKVEIKDAGSLSSWTSLVDMSWAYIYDKGVELKLPISVRVTSSSRNEVIIDNAFTSWTFSQINTNKDFGTGSTSAPTKAPTSAPTTAPTSAPTTAPTKAPTSAPTATPTTTPTSAPTTRPTSAPSGSLANAKLSVFSGASQWWFACVLDGVSGTIPKVEFKDATMTDYYQMSYQQWGYSVETRGSAFVAPVTVRVTNAAQQTASFTFSSITPNLQVTAN